MLNLFNKIIEVETKLTKTSKKLLENTNNDEKKEKYKRKFLKQEEKFKKLKLNLQTIE
jgi:hypothetical protein